MKFLPIYEELGIFSYEEDGFTVRLGQGMRKYLYDDVESILAYKVFDEPRMELVFGDCSLRVAECVPGWYQFVIKMREVFPSIPEEWGILMVVYRRDA